MVEVAEQQDDRANATAMDFSRLAAWIAGHNDTYGFGSTGDQVETALAKLRQSYDANPRTFTDLDRPIDGSLIAALAAEPSRTGWSTVAQALAALRDATGADGAGHRQEHVGRPPRWRIGAERGSRRKQQHHEPGGLLQGGHRTARFRERLGGLPAAPAALPGGRTGQQLRSIEGEAEQIVDSTPMLGAAAVQDTATLVRSGVRKLLDAVRATDAEAAEELASALRFDYSPRA